MHFLVEEQTKPTFNGDKEDYQFCIKRERYIENQILEYFTRYTGKDIASYFDSGDLHTKFDKDFILRADGNLINKYHSKQPSGCLNNRSHVRAIEHWLECDGLKPFLKRTMAFITYDMLFHCPESTAFFENDKNQIFIKSVSKNFSACAPLSELYLQHGYSMEKYGKSGILMISEPVNFVKEYRSFVCNGKILSPSLYEDYYYKDEDVTEVKEFTRQAHNRLVKNNPHFNNCVIDVGYLDSGDLALVEVNDVGAAGRYINNDFIEIVNAYTGLEIDRNYKSFVDEADKEIFS